MTYPYHVKANGRYYSPGEEVEETKEIDIGEEIEETDPAEKTTGRRGRKTE